MKALEAPRINRRIEQPFRHLGLLALLAVAPLAALVIDDGQAKLSILHVVVSFVVLMLAFRLIGKRELSRLSPFELVTLMLIPETLSNTVQGDRTLLQGLAGLCTLLALVLVMSLLSQRVPALQPVFEPEPAVLVLDGQLIEREMNRERIAPDELMSEMRKHGLGDLQQVHLAVLESSGNITFVRRSEKPS